MRGNSTSILGLPLCSGYLVKADQLPRNPREAHHPALRRKSLLCGDTNRIITKSVSRFARNTVDSLTTIRLLKEHGVEVYFEEQNIYTLDSKGELLLTIMSSLAQEESRNISENVTWGQRKRLADGNRKHFCQYGSS